MLDLDLVCADASLGVATGMVSIVVFLSLVLDLGLVWADVSSDAATGMVS